jgi:N utilization substance protein B
MSQKILSEKKEFRLSTKKGTYHKVEKSFKNKRKARELCVEGLYQFSYHVMDKEELINLEWFMNRNKPNEETLDYYHFLIRGVLKELDYIDSLIEEFAQKYSYDRMMPIDKAILRFAVFSLLFEKELENIIVINEAIEIAKEYSGIDAHKFINGVLDGINKQVTRKESQIEC